jgi:DNA mismatch endonuclease Vsr
MYDTASTPSAENLERMKWLLEENRYDLPNWLRPDCHASDHSYNSMYGRLTWDAPAQTVTTGFGSMGQGRYVHPARPRTITPHEAARLQMIPDFVDFSSARTRGSLARLVGNAVPPVLATAICELALSTIGHGVTTPVDTDGLPADVESQLKVNAGSNGAPSRGRRRRPMAPSRGQVGVPAASSDAVRRRMRATRQKDTKAEQAVQLELDRLGLAYAVDVSPLEGSRRRADIVFVDVKVAVYVDGCFWHGCPIHGTSAKSNAEWWHEKLKRNRERDHDTSRELHDHGWSVLRFWEHEDPEAAAAAIQSVVSQRKGGLAERTGTHHSGRTEA